MQGICRSLTSPPINPKNCLYSNPKRFYFICSMFLNTCTGCWFVLFTVLYVFRSVSLSFHQPSRLFDWLTATGIITFRVCQMIDWLCEWVNKYMSSRFVACMCVWESKWVREIECDRSGASWHEAVNTFSSEPAGADGVSDKCASVFDLQ